MCNFYATVCDIVKTQKHQTKTKKKIEYIQYYIVVKKEEKKTSEQQTTRQSR